METMGRILTLSHKGIFYYAYETDAVVIHNLMGYKLTTASSSKQVSCGFPESTLIKVLQKLKTLEISYRVFKPTKDNPVNKIKEEIFPDNHNYEKFSKRSDFSEAYDFLSEICDKCREYQNKPSKSMNGMKVVVDLESEEAFHYFSMIKQKLDEKGANYE